MPITCVEILADNTPGRSVELGPVLIGSANQPEDYAERAALRFDLEDLRTALVADKPPEIDHPRVIEVRGLPGGPVRCRVRCEVVRNYRAERVEG